jgi:hypothetical protein
MSSPDCGDTPVGVRRAKASLWLVCCARDCLILCLAVLPYDLLSLYLDLFWMRGKKKGRTVARAQNVNRQLHYTPSYKSVAIPVHSNKWDLSHHLRKLMQVSKPTGSCELPCGLETLSHEALDIPDQVTAPGAATALQEPVGNGHPPRLNDSDEGLRRMSVRQQQPVVRHRNACLLSILHARADFLPVDLQISPNRLARDHH